MLKDHYAAEDMNSVLTHIENLLNASTEVLKAAETANEEISKNAQFQINHSLTALMAYNRKKKKRDINHINMATRYNW